MKKLFLLMLCFFMFGAYSSGSRSYSTGSRSYSSSSSKSPSSSSSSSFKSFSTPSRSYSSGVSNSSSAPSVSSSKPTKVFDTKAASAQKVSESRKVFEAKKAESSSKSWGNYFSRTKPEAQKVSEPQVQRTKQETFYRKYYYDTTPRTVEVRNHYYKDNYNPFFWLWLMEQSSDQRALWAYNHRKDMDKERYNELLKKDADLEKKIKELETKGIKEDSNYKPQGIDNDLMYKEKLPEPKKEDGFSPYWFLLILVPLAGFLFWLWRF